MATGSPKTAGLFPFPPQIGKTRQKKASHHMLNAVRMPRMAKGNLITR